MLHVSLIFHTENSTHNPSFLLYIQKYHTLCNSISRLRHDQRGGHDTLRGKIPRARRSIEPINGWPKISIPSSFPNSFHEEDELGWIWYREWQEVIRMQFPRRERSLGLISRSVEGGERCAVSLLLYFPSAAGHPYFLASKEETEGMEGPFAFASSRIQRYALGTPARSRSDG